MSDNGRTPAEETMSESRGTPTEELLTKLIRERSYSGEESGVVAVLKAFFEENGFDDVVVDAAGNVIGVIEGNRPGKTVLFDGHIDTVPVQNPADWTHDPFGAEIDGGRMYGRGTSDMKGAVAAAACAAARFRRVTGGDFAGRICVSGVVHEECFEGVAAREISRRFRPDLVVIGEASELNLKIGQRGRMEIRVETFGIPAHSSNPEKGLNAVYGMCRVIEALRAIPVPESDFLGRGIMELTDIRSDPYPGASVVPEHCAVTYDRRLLTGETAESVLAPIREAIEELSRKDPSLKARASVAEGRETCYTGMEIADRRFFPAWEYSPDEPFVRRIFAALGESERLSPQLTHYSFCTNGSHYAGEAGIPTVGFGPSKESLAHTIDEYVELSDLAAAEDGYFRIMSCMCGKDA